MDIREILVQKKFNNLKIFDYYKSIGCTDNQSLVLSLYTYGRNTFAFNFYYGKYKESNLDMSLCDYLAQIILNTSFDSFVDILGQTDEYKNAEFEKGINKDMIFTSVNSVNSVNSFQSRGLFSRNIGKKSKSMNEAMLCSAVPNGVVEAKTISMPAEIFIDNIATDKYELIEEVGFLSPLTSPTSTFRMTSNTAAFGILRNNVKNNRNLLSSMVRIEELLNNFEYNLTKPNKNIFKINTQFCNKPNSKNKLLFIGVQGKDIIPQRQNITLLLDTSGSMSGNNIWTQAAMITIVRQLKENDVLSLVTYSSTDHTVIENMTITNKSFDNFIELLYSVDIHGCTYGSKGIETAYELAIKTYIDDGINRVILITDGDLNFGITEKGGLKDLILSKKDNGIFLSVLGTGLYNYKDDILEVLSKNGNGNYCTIDCIEDIKENIYEKYNSLVFTIAKDVKAQVEFNPKFVKSYRLIGYENRKLNHEDFKNDSIISEPFGCGGYGVALYELEMQDINSNIKSDFKYQQPVLTDKNSICTVSVRYKEPLATEGQELSIEVKNKTSEMKDNILLAYIITVIGEKLRDSKFLENGEYKFIMDSLYKNGLGQLYDKNSDKFKVLLSFVSNK